MSATLILLGSMVALGLLFVVLWALMLKVGLHWIGTPGGTMRRALLVAAGVLALMLVLWFVVGFVANRAGLTLEAMACAALFAALLYFAGSWWGITRAFHVSYARAIQAWSPTLVANGVLFVVKRFVFVPLVYDSYLIPTNSMAPTVLGEHVVDKCPTCGAVSFGTTGYHGFGKPMPAKLICGHFHTHKNSNYDPTLHSGSRIVALKVLKPRRWDVVVFRYPEDESQNYLKRLIGLPGETVTIVDGSIFINGVKLDPPEELREIKYVTKIDDNPWPDPVWGSLANPAVLGPDEYFMLGDNTQGALDSRFRQHGAPGHPPYAVPESYMIGTATHIYWPPERMRVLR